MDLGRISIWDERPLRETTPSSNWSLGRRQILIVLTVEDDSTYFPNNSFNSQLAGPMWGGPLHNRQFVEKVQETVDSLDDAIYVTKPRIKGFLSLAAEVRPHEPH